MGVGVVVLDQDILGPALLHDLPAVHHGDVAAGLRHGGDVVGDHDNADIELILEPRQQLDDLALGHHIQGGGWLVGNEDLRAANQGQRRPLLHAA